MTVLIDTREPDPHPWLSYLPDGERPEIDTPHRSRTPPTWASSHGEFLEGQSSQNQRIPISTMPSPVLANKTTDRSPSRKPDWKKVREAYLELRSPKLVGEMFGIKADTVKARARRHGWRNLPPQQSSKKSDKQPDYAHLAYLAYTGFLENLTCLASEHKKRSQQ